MRLIVVSHKRVWYYNGCYFTVGGFPRQMRMFQEIFDQVIICCPVPKEPVPPGAENISKMGLEVLPLRHLPTRTVFNKLRFLIALPGYWQTIRTILREADVVQVRIPHYIGIIGIYAARSLHKPIFVWLGGDWAGIVVARGRNTARMLFSVFLRWYLPRLFKDLLVLAPEPKVLGRNTMGINIIEVINTNIFKEEITKSVSPQIPKVDTRTSLLFVGRLDYIKGVDVLLNALSELKSLRWHLDIVGDGTTSLLDSLRQQAAELGISDRVRFHGRQPRESVRRYYELADILIVPSRNEMSPKVVIEAMANGVVVVASAVGAIPRLLAEGRGYLVEPGDSLQLARTLRSLIEKPEQLLTCSERSLEFARSNTVEAVAQQIEEALKEYLDIDKLKVKDCPTESKDV